VNQLVQNRRTDGIVSNNYAGVFAYIDDVNIYVHHQFADSIASELEEIFDKFHLQLSFQKCSYLIQNNNIQMDHPYFRVERNGLVLMGTPTGTLRFCKNKVMEKVESATSSVGALEHVSPWAAWNFLRHCITARVGYLARVVEPVSSMQALARFDKIIDEVVSKLAGPDVFSERRPERITLTNCIRSLPLALGGLGLLRFADVAGEKAVLLSRQVAYDFIEKNHNVLMQGINSSWMRITIGDNADSPFNALENVQLVGGGSKSLLLASQDEFNEEQVFESINARQICREVNTRRHFEVLDSLQNSGRTTEATFFRGSKFKGSGRWLTGRGGVFYGKFSFRSNDEYKVALRTRLLLSPALSGVDVGSTILCSCGRNVLLDSSPFHALDCGCSQWYFKHRHDAVRDVLAEFLEQNSSEDPEAYKIYVEPKVVGNEQVNQEEIEEALPENNNRMVSLIELRNRRHETVRADIGRYSRYSLITQYIDVAIVNSAAASYVALEQGDNYVGEIDGSDWRVEAGVAVGVQGSGGTAHREKSKVERYRRILGDKVDNPDYFVPFVVEATGRLGPAASKMIVSVLKESRSKMAKQNFISQIGAAIARNNAMLSLTWAKKNSPRDSIRF
jgi:hypothetical protein